MRRNLLADENQNQETKKGPVNLLGDIAGISSNPKEDESLLTSYAMAIPRTAKDLGDLIFEKMKKIPEYIEKGKTEIPGFVKTAQEHPGHLAKQILAGFPTLGHELINALPALEEYRTNRLHLPTMIPGVEFKVQPDISEDINQIFGKPEYPGENFARGIIPNAPNVLGTASLATTLNPLKLTNRSIIRDIIRARERNLTASQQRYNTVFNNANNANLGVNLPGLVPHLDFQTAFMNEPAHARLAANNFLQNPNVETAHAVKRDLLGIQRKLNKKNERESLTSGESAKLDAVNHAIQNIEANMFTDAQGIENRAIANEYRNAQHRHRHEVIPYTKNKVLNEYRAGDRLADEVVPLLMKGKFPARVGQHHRPLMIRRWAQMHPKTALALGIGTAAAGGLPLGQALYRYLLGEGNNE